MFQTEVVEKIKTHFFFGAVVFGACTFHARYQRLQTHTLGICNTTCFSAVTMVALTHNNVTLYIHCMYCYCFLHLVRYCMFIIYVTVLDHTL